MRHLQVLKLQLALYETRPSVARKIIFCDRLVFSMLTLWLALLSTSLSHVLVGMVLGLWKERVVTYSLLWWLVSSGFIPLIAYFMATTSNPILTVFTCLISSAFGQVLGGAFRAIGLTGGIATGKSTVSKCFRENRIPIIDADEISQMVMQPGYMAYKKTVAHFGPDILTKDGLIDRKKLGEIVFQSPAQRKVLNKCTHSSILFEMIWQLLKYRVLKQKRLVILDAPLLYETGILPWFCFPIIVVSCSQAVQEERLMKRDSLDQEQATARIQSQMPLEEKVKRCDIVIDNSGTLDQLRQRALEALRTTTKLLDGKVVKQVSQRTTL